MKTGERSKKRIGEKIIYISTFVANILLYLVIFSKISKNGIDFYFNSDALYFPTIFKDLFKDGYTLIGWFVPGAPNFLPDMLLYFIIMAFFSSPIYASFVYGIVQFLVILLLINWLINIISGKENYILNSLINLSMSLFFFVYIYGNDFLFTFHIISNTYHLGAFLFALLSFALTLKYLVTSKIRFLVILAIVATLAFFNDKLYAFMFSIPLFAIIIFLRSYKKSAVIKLLIVNIASVVVGFLLFRLVDIMKIIHFDNVDRLIGVSRFYSSFKLFSDQLLNMYKAKSFHNVIFAISIITFLFSLVYIFKDIKKFFFAKNTQTDNLEKWRYFYFLFFAVFAAIILSAPIVSGIYLDQTCIRYNIFAFYILTFNFFPVIYFLSHKIEKSKIVNNSLSVLCALVLATYLFVFVKEFKRDGFKEYLNYYPEVVQCVDNYIEKNQNIYGITTYWIGKVVLNFSKKDARLYTTYHDSFYPYPHVGNAKWYIDNTGKYSNPVYTFVVVSNQQDLSYLFRNYGDPIRTDTCGNYYIFTYNKFKFNNSYEPYFLDAEKFSKKTLFVDFEDEKFRQEKTIVLTDKAAYSGKYSNLLKDNIEFSYTFSVKYADIKYLKIRKIYLNTMLLFAQECNTSLIITIDDGDKNILWKNFVIDKSIYELNKWKDHKMVIELPDNLSDNALIKAFVWKPSKGEVYIDDLKLEFF